MTIILFFRAYKYKYAISAWRIQYTSSGLRSMEINDASQSLQREVYKKKVKKSL